MINFSFLDGGEGISNFSINYGLNEGLMKQSQTEFADTLSL